MRSDAPVGLRIEAETRLAQVWNLPPERISELTIEELRDVARALCDGAHRQSLLPEQLIVAVKHSWSAHAGAPRTRSHHAAIRGPLECQIPRA